MEIRVPGVTGLAHGEARTFEYHQDDEVRQGFVLRVQDGFVAYRNLCRHWSVDLDMGSGNFWSIRSQTIECKTHGARYDADSGVCVAGPCLGAQLEKFLVRLDGDDALVIVPE